MASALLLPALRFSLRSTRRNPIKTPRSNASGTKLCQCSRFYSNRMLSSPSIRTSSSRSFGLRRARSISAGHVSESPVKFNNYEYISTEDVGRRDRFADLYIGAFCLARTCNVLTKYYPPPPSTIIAPPTQHRYFLHSQFVDEFSDVELRLQIVDKDALSPKDIIVDVDDLSLKIEVRTSKSCVTLMETNNLYGRIKPSETIWYLDEDQLVVNLKKYHTDLKWPDLSESWSSLTKGVAPLLKGTSIYLVGESTEINQKVARELASGIGYVPLLTSELLERYAQQPVDSWLMEERADSVIEAEAALIESLSSQVRAVVATLGGKHGAARRDDKWRHLYAGFTIWLSESEAADETSAKEAARKHIEDGIVSYSNAEVVLKLGGWEFDSARIVAQACLSALKQLVLSDKTLTGKKSLYIRGGCRGDWPNIQPPGCNPLSGDNYAPDA